MSFNQWYLENFGADDADLIKGLKTVWNFLEDKGLCGEEIAFTIGSILKTFSDETPEG